MASFYCIYCILVPTLALEEHIQTSGYIEKVQLPTRTRVLANMRWCESHHISPIRKTALCSRCNLFSVCEILAEGGLANALEKAGTGAFSDSGADLIPEILKFELKLTLKLTLRLISKLQIEESDLLEGAGLLVVEVVVVGAGVVVDLVLCESLSSSSLARREWIVDKGTSCN